MSGAVVCPLGCWMENASAIRTSSCGKSLKGSETFNQVCKSNVVGLSCSWLNSCISALLQLKRFSVWPAHVQKHSGMNQLGHTQAKRKYFLLSLRYFLSHRALCQQPKQWVWQGRFLVRVMGVTLSWARGRHSHEPLVPSFSQPDQTLSCCTEPSCCWLHPAAGKSVYRAAGF